MSAVTDRRAVDEVVMPAMDGIALNHYQARALHNPATPEIDSAIERIGELANYDVPPALIEALRADLWLVAELNGRERQCQRTVAGNGERMARDLKPGTGRQSLKRPALARQLRPILSVYTALNDPRQPTPSAREITLARGAMRDVRRTVPIDTLLSRSLAHELGETPTRTLHDLLEQDGD